MSNKLILRAKEKFNIKLKHKSDEEMIKSLRDEGMPSLAKMLENLINNK